VSTPITPQQQDQQETNPPSPLTAGAVADEVVTLLNARFPSESDMAFTASRVAIVRFDVADLDAITVSVIPRSSASEYITRGAVGRELGVDVAVQKRLGQESDTVTEVDSLSSLAETVRAYLMANPKLSALGDVRLTAAEMDPLYFQNHLLEKSVFTSVISLTYQYAEALP